MSLNLLTNLHLADSNWSVSVPDILVCSENIFITLSCSSLTKCFTAPSISRLNIYPLAFLRGSFHSLQPWASPRLCGRRSPINYSLMTSVAARLGRKKKLIYLSRGNCLGAVSAHESSLRSLFLSDRPDEGHLTIVITSMDWPAHQVLPATYLNSQLSAVSSATTANALIATTQKYFSTEVLLMKEIGMRNKWIGNANLAIWHSFLLSVDIEAPSLLVWRLAGVSLHSLQCLLLRASEHPNLAGVNDPPALTHLNRERS